MLSLYPWSDASLQASDGKWNNPASPVLYAGSATVLSSAAWNAAVTAGVWQQITMSYSAGVAKCHVNGTQVATTSASCNAGRTNVRVFTLGNFDGDIDEVRISNIARTPAAP